MVHTLPRNLTAIQLLKAFLGPVTDESVSPNSVFALFGLISVTEEREFLYLVS
jgi:hypothetical protein